MIDFSRARKIQEETRRRAIFNQDLLSNIELVGALDVSYRKNKALSVVVVYDFLAGEIIEIKSVITDVKAPYVPGYFFLREINPLVAVYTELENKPDVVLINGHGYSHPRRAGIATYFGILMSVLTIGVAKKLLIGTEKCSNELREKCYVIDGDEVIGMVIVTNKEKWYISTGHGVSLDSAFRIIKRIIDKHNGSLYPMIIVDSISKRCWSSE